MNTTPTESHPLSLRIILDTVSLEVLPDYIYQIEVRRFSQVLHEHAIHELYYIESGEMELECSDGMYRLDTGDLFVIGAGDAHRVAGYSEELRWFHLRFRVWAAEAEMVPIRTCLFSGYRSDIMAALVENIRSYRVGDDAPMALFRLKAYMGIFFSYVLEGLTPDGIEKSKPVPKSGFLQSRIIRYSQIDTFLYDNCVLPITLDDLAKHLNYSRVQTGRIVRECCGMSFTEKLREIRIRLAKQLLTSGELPMEQVAERCGYQTRQGFEAAFTRVVGISPARFRKGKGK